MLKNNEGHKAFIKLQNLLILLVLAINCAKLWLKFRVLRKDNNLCFRNDLFLGAEMCFAGAYKFSCVLP